MLEVLLVFLSITTVAFSLAVKVIGMPHQIRQLMRHPESALGLSLPYNVIGVGSYTSLLCYSALKQDWVVGGPAAVGVIGAVWICVLLIRARMRFGVQTRSGRGDEGRSGESGDQ